jgi:flavin-dependent dehydrogenase
MSHAHIDERFDTIVVGGRCAGAVTAMLLARAGVTALYAPRRTVLDQVLADAAERAGAQIRTGARVTEVLPGSDGHVSAWAP